MFALRHFLEALVYILDLGFTLYKCSSLPGPCLPG